jgi:hypothetical protein
LSVLGHRSDGQGWKNPDIMKCVSAAANAVPTARWHRC